VSVRVGDCWLCVYRCSWLLGDSCFRCCIIRCLMLCLCSLGCMIILVLVFLMMLVGLRCV